MLTDIEKKVIASIQGDIPIVERPYQVLAQGLGITEEKFIQTLQQLTDRGVIRRFGATLRHQKSGFRANAMTAWQVDEGRIEAVGHIMASFPAVSHCYRRDPADGWPYNLYTMIHGKSEDECRETARRMAEKAGVTTYQLLFSRKELKKISMTYFPDVLEDMDLLEKD
ncbi:MAG: AsnC family protein [Proteobacteria bacterium]|nr:MAG: AsnC family protein [Pseudomonadota bacterium]PIE67383.1 MAG: AsnC family protein [Deltaproteobacteria bacterium]